MESVLEQIVIQRMRSEIGCSNGLMADCGGESDG